MSFDTASVLSSIFEAVPVAPPMLVSPMLVSMTVSAGSEQAKSGDSAQAMLQAQAQTFKNILSAQTSVPNEPGGKRADLSSVQGGPVLPNAGVAIGIMTLAPKFAPPPATGWIAAQGQETLYGLSIEEASGAILNPFEATTSVLAKSAVLNSKAMDAEEFIKAARHLSDHGLTPTDILPVRPDSSGRGENKILEQVPESIKTHPALERDPKKWIPLFGKIARKYQILEQAFESIKTHPALEGLHGVGTEARILDSDTIYETSAAPLDSFFALSAPFSEIGATLNAQTEPVALHEQSRVFPTPKPTEASIININFDTVQKDLSHTSYPVASKVIAPALGEARAFERSPDLVGSVRVPMANIPIDSSPFDLTMAEMVPANIGSRPELPGLDKTATRLAIMPTVSVTMPKDLGMAQKSRASMAASSLEAESYSFERARPERRVTPPGSPVSFAVPKEEAHTSAFKSSALASSSLAPSTVETQTAQQAVPLSTLPLSAEPVATAPTLGTAMTGQTPDAPSGSPSGPSSEVSSGVSLSQIAVETLNDLGLQIQKRLKGDATHFNIELHPADMGRVDISLQFAKDGKITAQLVFESSLSASSFSASEKALRQHLADVGIELSDDAISISSRTIQTKSEIQPTPCVPSLGQSRSNELPERSADTFQGQTSAWNQESQGHDPHNRGQHNQGRDAQAHRLMHALNQTAEELTVQALVRAGFALNASQLALNLIV